MLFFRLCAGIKSDFHVVFCHFSKQKKGLRVMSRVFRNSKKSALLLALALTAAMFAACANARQSEIELGKAAYSARDYEKAVKHYRAAAEQGDAEAQYLLGQCCLKGKGLPVGKKGSHQLDAGILHAGRTGDGGR